MFCVSCRAPNDPANTTCTVCGTPLKLDERAPLDQEIARRFRCSKGCHAESSSVRTASTGTGTSKMLDVQTHRFVAVSCTSCGFTEFYNLNILEGQDHLGDIMDFLFGG